MRRLLLVAAACGLALFAAAAGADNKLWVAEKLDSEAVATVWTYIEHKDCAGAAKALNAGVAKGFPSVLLLAGAMFEDGICLKSNWLKAADFYQRAHEAGHPRAASKLASGYMSAAAGPDKAAALWWALRRQLALPDACRTPLPSLDDADKFVDALRAWPAGRLDACGYVAGVVGTIDGDLEFSRRAAAHGLKGVIVTRYAPAQERIDISADALEFIQVGGVTSGDDGRDRDSNAVKREFERDIRAAADRALKRYTRPQGIDPAWRLTIKFEFGYVLR
jgi:hypothetical protein